MVTSEYDTLKSMGNGPVLADHSLPPSKLIGKTSQLKDLLFQIREKLGPVLPDGSAKPSDAKTAASRLERELDDLIEIASLLKDEINL
jgi:hypothetical protein